MNGRDRVLKAINYQPLDRIPRGEIFLPAGLVSRAMGSAADDHKACLRMKHQFLMHYHHDLVVLSSPAESGPEDRARVLAELDYWQNESELFSFLLIDGGFSRTREQMGWKEFFCRLAERPQEIRRSIQAIYRQIPEQMSPFIERGIDGIMLGDDFAFSQGPMVSPDFLRNEYFPVLASTLNEMRMIRKLPVFLHTDGQISEFLDDLAEVGFQGLQGLQPLPGQDLGRCRQIVGERLCLMGNLEISYLLKDGGRELEGQVSQILAAAGRTGFIFSTASGLIDEIEPSALDELDRLLGKYQGS